MLKLGRACIPLGLDCNLRCSYCYRGLSVGSVPTKMSPLMREYLQFIDPEWCQAVIMSGGEPLLYMDTVREIFSLLKPKVHKKFMTNGTLLTQEIVDYFNSLDVEVSLSHDGAVTKELRGVDVLEDPELLKVIKQIKVLTISGVVTNKNPNVMDNYNDTAKKLGRTNFYYMPGLVYYNGFNQDLIDGFDYNTYIRTHREERYYHHMHVPYYSYSKKGINFNLDLEGNIIDKNTLQKYGTVLDTREECMARLKEAYKDCYCNRSNCPIKDICHSSREESSEHMCKVALMREGYA